MAFQISSQLSYGVSCPSTVLLNLHALSTKRQKLKKEKLVLTPNLKWEEFPLETGHNRYIRLETGTVPELTLSYTAMVETKPTVVSRDKINAVPMAQLHQSALPYLFPSRYCQSDRLGRLALKLFGNFPHPLDQVMAISDWIFDNIDYISGATDAATSAFDTVTQRAGVCRDFAHLGIALCRALSIPARYVTGYVCLLQPQDFHACFEACIGNKWYLFDPTRLAPLNGLVRIATGRDAADASIATIFGGMFLQSMQVDSQCPGFKPIYRQDLDGQAVLLEG
ncbi:MAG: Transglutaminase [Akkermansiaceae bacterium]|nr:Transglutaminase [Akkermansiaceae bacterium]